MSREDLDWDLASWVFPLAVIAALALVVAVVAGRPDVIVFFAPLLGALAGGWWASHPAGWLRIETSAAVERLFEEESTPLSVRVTAPPGVDIVAVELETGPEVRATLERMERPSASTAHGHWRLQAVRWGRTQQRLRITVRGQGGLLVAETVRDVGELAIFPHARALASVPRPMDLPDLLGVHISRRKGEGVEFAGVRPYLPGDSPRTINWRATARHGDLQVTERLTEQAAKVIALIDASGDVDQPGGSTLELSVHGALDVVQAALRRGDRAGVVALGGVIRWLSPDLGQRQFYRVVEALLDVAVGSGAAPSDTGGIPRSVLPRGAALVVFSPLLDERVLEALTDLRRRGYGLAVVDVLRAEPKPRPEARYDHVAVRMWRIGRRGLRFRLSNLGIPVGEWRDDITLDEVLGPMSLRPLPGGRHG